MMIFLIEACLFLEVNCQMQPNDNDESGNTYMEVIQIIALIFVSCICVGIICFVFNLWKKWIKEIERNQSYHLDYLVSRERIREDQENNRQGSDEENHSVSSL